MGPKSELTAREDEWQRRATAAAVAASRRLVKKDVAIPANTPISRLSDVEWGWIVATVIFAWISVRAEQATAEGLDVERAFREGADGAWDAGAIAAILPQLADTSGIDMSVPLAEWPRETMLHFLVTALGLARKAMAARDRGPGITRKSDMPLPV
jgi:hypothetical protein